MGVDGSTRNGTVEEIEHISLESSHEGGARSILEGGNGVRTVRKSSYDDAGGFPEGGRQVQLYVVWLFENAQ